MSIWQATDAYQHKTVLRGTLIRVVESQEQMATNQLVDNLEEQLLLEKMLEDSKPVLKQNSSQLHYLLSTPFRYPPLEHGSRFGSRFEPAIFYASKKLSTAFSETAFYRFYFWLGMSSPPPSGKFTTEHTVFHAKYYSTNALKLHQPPFNEFEHELRHPFCYNATQEFGTELRKHQIDLIEFVSARDIDKGLNLSLFQPGVLTSKKPEEQQQWLCETTEFKIAFSSKTGEFYTFPIENFLVDSQFPQPAK